MAQYINIFSTYNELVVKQKEIVNNIHLLIKSPIIKIKNKRLKNNSWKLTINVK